MESKDNRHKAKRSNMRHHKKSFHRNSTTGNGSSSSQIIRGVIDVADSSDDRVIERPISWSPKAIESELEIDTENEQMRAADFELLMQMPNSAEGHFKFSSEKNWDSEDMILDKTEASEYFTLDLNLLNAGLQTIPFYKRLDFSPSWFTKSQLKIMNTAAESAEKQYQIVLEEHENNQKEKFKAAKKAPSRRPNSSANSTNSKANEVLNDNDKELDELLSLTTNGVAKASINEAQTVEVETKKSTPPSETNNAKPIQGAESREGIQQWLDDVLEE